MIPGFRVVHHHGATIGQDASAVAAPGSRAALDGPGALGRAAPRPEPGRGGRLWRSGWGASSASSVGGVGRSCCRRRSRAAWRRDTLAYRKAVAAVASCYPRGRPDADGTFAMRDLLRYRDLVWTLVARDLKVRYRRSTIGFLWTMLQPLLTMLVLQAVFSHLFRVDIANYAVYALAGVMCWNFFSQSIVSSMNSLRGNSNLLKKLPVPQIVFPIATVTAGVVNLLLALVPLFAILLVTGHRIDAGAALPAGVDPDGGAVHARRGLPAVALGGLLLRRRSRSSRCCSPSRCT